MLGYHLLPASDAVTSDVQHSHRSHLATGKYREPRALRIANARGHTHIHRDTTKRSRSDHNRNHNSTNVHIDNNYNSPTISNEFKSKTSIVDALDRGETGLPIEGGENRDTREAPSKTRWAYLTAKWNPSGNHSNLTTLDAGK